jgi:hypothetical protein
VGLERFTRGQGQGAKAVPNQAHCQHISPAGKCGCAQKAGPHLTPTIETATPDPHPSGTHITPHHPTPDPHLSAKALVPSAVASSVAEYFLLALVSLAARSFRRSRFPSSSPTRLQQGGEHNSKGQCSLPSRCSRLAALQLTPVGGCSSRGVEACRRQCSAQQGRQYDRAVKWAQRRRCRCVRAIMRLIQFPSCTSVQKKQLPAEEGGVLEVAKEKAADGRRRRRHGCPAVFGAARGERLGD